MHAVVARSTFLRPNVKTPHARTTFEGSDVVSRGRRKGFCTLPKVSKKTWGHGRISKTMAGVGHLKRIWKDAFHMAGDMFIRDVRRSGRWFPERGCILSIRSSGLLRWFCVTVAALRMTWHHFCGQAQHFKEMQCKNREAYWYEAVSSALSFPLLKEVLQNCLVFDLVNFENWRKSRRIASFLTLSS